MEGSIGFFAFRADPACQRDLHLKDARREQSTYRYQLQDADAARAAGGAIVPPRK